MAAVTIHSDFVAQENEFDTISIISPFIYHEMIGVDAMIFIFWMLHFKPAVFAFLFHLHQEAL